MLFAHDCQQPLIEGIVRVAHVTRQRSIKLHLAQPLGLAALALTHAALAVVGVIHPGVLGQRRQPVVRVLHMRALVDDVEQHHLGRLEVAAGFEIFVGLALDRKVPSLGD